MKTLSELKRNAKSGTLEGRMTLWHGETAIPERLQGWRRIVKSNSVALFFQSESGQLFELSLPRASLVEYDGTTLLIYYAGYRDLTPEEQHVMDEWKAIANTPEFKERAQYDALSDGSSTYHEELSFFRKAGYEYLMGLKEQHGMKYDWNSCKIRDKKIKGTICLQYEIRNAA